MTLDPDLHRDGVWGYLVPVWQAINKNVLDPDPVSSTGQVCIVMEIRGYSVSVWQMINKRVLDPDTISNMGKDFIGME